jgi:hypothetical protein
MRQQGFDDVPLDPLIQLEAEIDAAVAKVDRVSELPVAVPGGYGDVGCLMHLILWCVVPPVRMIVSALLTRRISRALLRIAPSQRPLALSIMRAKSGKSARQLTGPLIGRLESPLEVQPYSSPSGRGDEVNSSASGDHDYLDVRSQNGVVGRKGKRRRQ